MVSASRTTTQPDGVFHVVDQDVGSGLVRPRRRVVDPERAEPEVARLTVEQGAEDAGGVEAAGRRASRSRRRARSGHRCGSWTGTRSRRSAGTGRVRRRSAVVLRAFMTPPTGRANRRTPRSARRPPPGPRSPGAYAWTGGGASSSGCMTRQVSSTPSCRVKRVLSPTMRGVQQHLVRRRRPRRPRSANSMSRSILPTAEMSARRASRINLIPVDGSSLTTSWLASVVRPHEPEARAAGDA